MITAAGFWKGRDVQFADQLTDEIRGNANMTISRANALLGAFLAANKSAHDRDATSGWRPAAVNAATPGAAVHSQHMVGNAVDIEDGDGQLDAWLITPDGQAALVRLGLWMESPASTPGWAHTQRVSPASGHRIFIP